MRAELTDLSCVCFCTWILNQYSPVANECRGDILMSVSDRRVNRSKRMVSKRIYTQVAGGMPNNTDTNALRACGF